ncbi:probable L-type lectin-domain containing receptor kinase VII.2 isoform X3 [Vigna radiata var. radiata]|uniref:non-specific serine/threonine protein kinase n=1 Tax=Vigna radiata var. radiata TaxID=3916 RepID=A0A3Q0EV30_VIGRR|nr:probable L-type lectin-domain containing receptor kinase VII.2 isoform X3 [Vigna radiata var. radiata]
MSNLLVSSLLLITNVILLNSVSSIEFIYNTNFNSTNTLIYGNATIESSILTLTNSSTFSVGRAFYPSKIPTKSSNSSTPLPFSTSFIFSIAPFKGLLPGHGFVFIFTPSAGTTGVSSAQHLGLFNLTNNGDPNNHVFGIEFDVFDNQEFDDIDENHVGVDINSLVSFSSHAAGFWGGNDGDRFEDLKLNNGQLVESHKILAWSFSNSNVSIGDALVTSNLPSFVLPRESILRSKGFVVGITIGVLFVIGSAVVMFVFLLRRKRSKRKEEEEDIEDWELEYWPHRVRYEDIYAATKGFSDQNVIGFGGNGKVYKGLLQGVQVAVKRIPYDSKHGMREFLSEISSLGRLKHRNVVPLRGWCKKEKGSLILIYDYMENGSLDKRIFDGDENTVFGWEERVKVLKDVAHGILYLHDGWEVKVLHRDIKSSNVLLDKDMNARLGDFGLATMHHHEQIGHTSQVIGTVGFMAPELVHTGRASTQSDVFSFGMLVLEVVCGRRPNEENKPTLVVWLMGLMERGKEYCGLDERLKGRSECECKIDEVKRVIHLGLLCTHPDPHVRPSMRQVVKVLEGEDLDGSLVEKINSAAEYVGSFGNSIHPTIQDIFASHGSYSTVCNTEGR